MVVAFGATGKFNVSLCNQVLYGWVQTTKELELAGSLFNITIIPKCHLFAHNFNYYFI